MVGSDGLWWRVVWLVVVLGVTLKHREVLRGGGATVEKICVKVWVVPKPHGTLTSAGLTGRSSRTLTSVEARPLRFSLVVPGHFIGISLPSDFLGIPANTEAADVREVDLIEEPQIIPRNIIECCYLKVS